MNYVQLNQEDPKVSKGLVLRWKKGGIIPKRRAEKEEELYERDFTFYMLRPV